MACNWCSNSCTQSLHICGLKLEGNWGRVKEDSTEEETCALCLGRSQSLIGKHDEIGEAFQTSKVAGGKQGDTKKAA